MAITIEMLIGERAAFFCGPVAIAVTADDEEEEEEEEEEADAADTASWKKWRRKSV